MGRARSIAGNWRVALPVAGGAVVLGLGGLYVTGLLVTGDDIAPGTRVSGVDIGGLSPAAAQRTLERELGPVANAPVELKIAEQLVRTAPDDLGLSLDAKATVERAGGTGSGPGSVFGRLFAAQDRDVQPVVRLDTNRGKAELDRIGSATRQQVREGAISFEGGRANPVTPVTGVTLVSDQALETVRAAYARALAAGRSTASGASSGKAAPRTPVELPVRRTAPLTGAQETARAMREFARPAMSAPITLDLAGERLTLSPTVIGRHLTMKADAQGRLEPALDAKGLYKDPAVARPVREAARTPKDAEFRVGQDGRAVVARDATVGRHITDKALGKAVLPLLTRSGAAARTGEVDTTVVQPKLTKASAAKLGINEKVSSFTVEFPAAPYRITNISRAVELINGSVVLPGEEWSFNRTVGERTKENGFVDGIMINDGRYVKSPGGGVSAVATTMYNAMFFAGVKPVEYAAHSFYIERYPEGREATVAWGSLDLRWLNDSGHAIYVQAQSTDTSVTITFLGTKKYDEIRATKGPRTNIKQPSTRTLSGPTCEVQSPLEGFDVTVGRVFVNDGRELKRENFKTHYTPRDEVVCAEEPESNASLPPQGTAEKVPTNGPRLD